MRAWVVCMLAVLTCGCQRPSKPAVPRPVSRAPLPKPHLRGIHLGPGERAQGDAVSEALQQGWVCLDLPGAARSHLWTVGKGLRFAQLQTDVGARRWDLMAVEPDDPTPTVLIRDVGPQPLPVQGEEVVFLRTDAATEQRSLWRGDPQHPDGVAVSAPGHVLRVAVDPVRHVAWYLQASHEGQAPQLWHWQPGGVPKLSEYQGSQFLGLLPGGMPVFQGGPQEDWRHDHSPVLDAWGNTAIVKRDGGQFLVLTEQGPAVPLPDAATTDVPLFQPGGPWIVHRDGRFQRLSLVDGKALQPIAALGPVEWAGAAKLQGGVVAALLTHDTDQSGAHDGEDENDVCLVARAIQPLEIPERSVPLRFVSHLDALRARLAADGIAVKSLRFVRAEPPGLSRSTRLQVIAQGPPPMPAPLPADATPGQTQDEATYLLHWLEALHGRLLVEAGDPQLGLDIEWPEADRQALADWHEGQGRFLHRVRLGERVLGVREEYLLELEAVTLRGGVLDQGAQDETQVCEGTLRNLSDRPLTPRVQCDGTDAVLDGPIAPGGVAPWTWHGQKAGPMPTVAFYLRNSETQAVVQVPVFDARAAHDIEEWLLTSERIVKETGFRHTPPPLPRTGEPIDPGFTHDVTHFLAPQGLALLAEKDRRKLVKSLWNEVVRHLSRTHRTGPTGLVLEVHDADGHRWTVDKGVLEPVQAP